MHKKRFGIFMPPFNAPATQNATSSLQRNVDTIRLLDDLGYDEAWVGEHHSGGAEIIADPIQFMCYVGALTRHIKLGPGVVSVPYHNPLWVADRIILADHLLRGRVMFGMGPGSLPTDASMIGLEPKQLRPSLDHDAGVVIDLIRGKRVTVKTDRYSLVDAQCQLAPYSDFDIAVAASTSPAGSMLCGRHGIGMLSLGALMREDMNLMHLHWNRAEAEAEKHGKTVDRDKWRPRRLYAPGRDAREGDRGRALRPAAFRSLHPGRAGAADPARHRQELRGAARLVHRGRRRHHRHARRRDRPHQAADEQSGGFGAYLMVANDFASWEATRKHYELFARYVMPCFQPSQARLLESERYAMSRHAELDAKNGAAIQSWTDQHAVGPGKAVGTGALGER